MSRKAPWPDFAGQSIHEGDWIEHPNGDRARVAYSMDPRHDGASRWRAVYRDDESLWLGNQIGDKGRAVVVSALVEQPVDKRRIQPLPQAEKHRRTSTRGADGRR